MFYGFQLIKGFIVLIFFLWILFKGLLHKEKIFGKIAIFISTLFFVFIFSKMIYGQLSKKKILDKDDFYGQYIINRNYFKGKQADWQYEHFWFEILKNDSIYFYELHNGIVLNTYKGVMETNAIYPSVRINIKMDEPKHHIFTTGPTIYRKAWSFILVFNSPKFNNMYFKKGKWRAIK